MGEVLEVRGERAKAIGCFEKAVTADPRHGAALFKLAFHNDRAGNDEQAIALYERCLRLPPPRMGTLINLGLLYEDNERYNQAAYCFEQVLRKYGDHSRARLFLRDANASRTQFYDEDAEKRSDAFNAILDMPVTDFELSVRSRNCLKKMNIRSLRDLANVSEQHLLASKNFGETSLQEIKQMLAMKGLTLGQNLEKVPKKVHPAFNPEDYSPQEQALFNKPIGELNFSVRSRKCMTRLGITTIGELVAHSGDELLECKNFGVTSLVEVRDKLKALGLKLRGD
jgi:DNA-directed RNA polymerase subunit alpha